MFSNAETLSIVTYERCWRIFKRGNTQQFYGKDVGELKNVETLSIATLKALGDFQVWKYAAVLQKRWRIFKSGNPEHRYIFKA